MIHEKINIIITATVIYCIFFFSVCVTNRALTAFFLFVIRAFASGVFQAVYVYTPEVYPTKIRGLALGLCTSSARIGAILTPYAAQVCYIVHIDLVISVIMLLLWDFHTILSTPYFVLCSSICICILRCWWFVVLGQVQC